MVDSFAVDGSAVVAVDDCVAVVDSAAVVPPCSENKKSAEGFNK